MKEEEIDNLEQIISLLASGAFRQAYFDTLSSGNSVLEVIDDVLYEVYPSGRKQKIKAVPKNIKVDMSQKVYLC
jgi:hypothetical protein